MAEYLATCITGFEKICAGLLQKDLSDVRVRDTMSGLLRFRTSENRRRLKELLYLNNVYFVMKAYERECPFEEMVSGSKKGALAPLIRKGTFRVRFSDANRFVSVPKSIISEAERQVMSRSGLVTDRVTPQTEIWYIRRTEGIGFYAQLLWKRRITEKNLPQGQLRPEMAHLLCRMVDLPAESTVLDPFAGFGSIPEQLRALGLTVYASDLDPEKAVLSQGQVCDARNLTFLDQEVLDAIITDPPWGIFEKIEDIPTFYASCLKEWRRVLKPSGYVIALTAAKQEWEEAAEKEGFRLMNRIDTLVNGKKAAVFVLKKD